MYVEVCTIAIYYGLSLTNEDVYFDAKAFYWSYCMEWNTFLRLVEVLKWLTLY